MHIREEKVDVVGEVLLLLHPEFKNAGLPLGSPQSGLGTCTVHTHRSCPEALQNITV